MIPIFAEVSIIISLKQQYCIHNPYNIFVRHTPTPQYPTRQPNREPTFQDANSLPKALGVGRIGCFHTQTNMEKSLANQILPHTNQTSNTTLKSQQPPSLFQQARRREKPTSTL